jgi:hypothetical protein
MCFDENSALGKRATAQTRKWQAHVFIQSLCVNFCAQSSDSFLRCFRSNLIDVGIDPRMFGTHSFRRGGCQYLHFGLRWSIVDICSWGGWAADFDNWGTIFKYLMSWTDAQRIRREDFFDVEKRTMTMCGGCGRTCRCF